MCYYYNSIRIVTYKHVLQEVINALDRFSLFHHIWKKDREETILKFIQANPLLSEFESQILYYRDLELEINIEPEFILVGALALFTGTVHTDTESAGLMMAVEYKLKKYSVLISPTADLKLALTTETKSWIVDFGHHCNRKYRMEMEQIFAFVDEASKKLNRQIKDLDDIRITMATLKEIRENQISIDFQVGPIEVKKHNHLLNSVAAKNNVVDVQYIVLKARFRFCVFLHTYSLF